MKTKPCKTCPFSRTNEAKENRLGGSDWETYIGQAKGNFWLPCHCSKDYFQDMPIDMSKQCAGARMFRANINADVASSIKADEPNTELVFANEVEFIQEYNRKANGGKILKRTIEEALTVCKMAGINLDVLTEIEKAKYIVKTENSPRQVYAEHVVKTKAGFITRTLNKIANG
jgi:hypothetical protein